ncbi:hypothetical protein BGZ91_006855 [Linnemannia elongata]|nr:hypothetical protein BGZ91_006855 [Linnemannia elongata]
MTTAKDTASGVLHSATDHASGTTHTAAEIDSGPFLTVTEKDSGALHAAIKKTQSAKQSLKQADFTQRYIIGPAVYTKECFVTGSRMVPRYMKSEMWLARLFISVFMIIVVLGYMTFSGLSLTVSKDNVVKSKFKVHPPTPRSALWTSAWVGLVSILATLVIPPAFAYIRVHVLRSRNKKNETKGKGSGPDSAPVSNERPISSTIERGPFETYRKQAGKTGTGGGCRHPRHGANATVDAVSEALTAAQKHTDKEE